MDQENDQLLTEYVVADKNTFFSSVKKHGQSRSNSRR